MVIEVHNSDTQSTTATAHTQWIIVRATNIPYLHDRFLLFCDFSADIIIQNPFEGVRPPEPRDTDIAILVLFRHAL